MHLVKDFLFSKMRFCLDLRQHFTVSYPGSELSVILLPWLPREGVAGVGHVVFGTSLHFNFHFRGAHPARWP